MKDYKECDKTEFEAVMAKYRQKAEPASLTNQELYILTTKLRADMQATSGGSSPYQLKIYWSTKKSYEKYEKELRSRM